MTATMQLDEDLTLEESPWRGRIITLLILLVIAAAVGVGLYFFYFTETTTVARATEDISVKRATINQTLIVSGVADAQLNSNLVFQSPGKVSSVNVKIGDVVKQGDVLASLESEDLANAVASARANQQAGQLKLDKLLSGGTQAELAAADQAVAQADAAFTKAQNDLNDLTNGGSAADLAAAEQGVRAAEAQVASAQSTREKLDNTPSDADKAAAEAGVAASQSALTAAQNSATSADNSVTSASAALKSAENTYCAQDGTPDFCTPPAAPISSVDADRMNTALDGPNAALASAVIAGNGSYLNAVNAANSADASVTSAENALASAQAKLDLVEEGPTSEEIAAAEAAVTSAEAALAAANQKLTTLQQGGTALQRSTLEAGLESAQAALVAAQARRDEAYRGPEQNAIDQGLQAVRTAQLAVEAAQIRLKNAQIIAPFDGTVAAVNAKKGEFFGASTTSPAIVLLTPDVLTLKINVGETDYPSIKVDQGGVVIFDSIPGKPYPFKVTEIGLSPTVTQGVVTYEVRGSLVIIPGNPRPAPGMNARGQITTDSKPNVLVIPPRAIRRRGNEQVVDVKRNGAVEEQVVTTGASDTEQVEVLTGVAENDIVVVASLTTAKPGATPKAQPTLPGGVK